MVRPVRHSGRAAIGLALGAAALAACSSGAEPSASQAPSPSTSATPGTDASATPATGQEQYVALGDSYTSAPFVGEQSGPGVCLQTDGNYPHLLAARLDLELADVSCGGAQSRDLRRPQFSGGDGVGPQLDAVTADTDLVTLSLGANDNNLFGRLVRTCLSLGPQGGGGSCAGGGRFGDNTLDTDIAALERRTVSNVAAVRERAPGARVVVVGYPQIVPAAGTCPELPLVAADQPFARSVNERLAAAVKAGAERAQVDYVDMWVLSEGHDVCAAEPWVAGARPVGPAAPLHPYPEHQAAVADALAGLLDD